MATMTFQYGEYFGSKVIYLENDIGDPQILIHKMVCLSILNYVGEWKKNLWSRNFLYYVKVIIHNIFFAPDFFLNCQNNKLYYAKSFFKIKFGGHRCRLRVKLL